MFINLLESNNVFEDVLLPSNLRNKSSVLNINEHFNSQIMLGANVNTDADKANVYFYRCIGFNNKDEYIKKLDTLNQKLSILGNMYLRFNNKIPQPYNVALMDKTNRVLGSISELDVRNERGIEILNSEELFKVTNDSKTNLNVKNAFYTIIRLYAGNEPIPTLSIERNFINKLMLWIHEYIPKVFSMKTDEQMPKIVYFGSIKKHEVYFLILMSQIGCDVLYINSENEGDYLKVDKNSVYSKLMELPQKAHIDYEFRDVEVVKERKQEPVVRQTSTSQRIIEDTDKAMIILKNALNIFEDIAFPLSKRTGYIGLPSPILPIYFYRCIGIEGADLNSEDEYYNKVYNLDQKLTNLGTGYVKFIDHIPPPQNDEIDKVVDKLKNVFNTTAGFDKNLIISNVIKTGILDGSRDILVNKLVNTAFERVIKLYISKEPNINLGRFQNFIYKLLVWLNRYYKILYINKGFSDSPKVLHYGEIKAHEVYFLILLSNIGCDILYLTTEEQRDKALMEIDPNEEYTNLMVYDKMLPMQSFPEKERVIRKATTAFNASRELEDIIYNEEVGLFRPWQFEDYNIRPITLRTTYDELKILWSEDAKIRPEFKVDNGVVYIPNLFAKVSGTPENLEQYWEDYRHFTKHPNTIELKKVPFTSRSFTRQELYSIAFLLDKNGLINREALQSSNYYKFGYLRTSLQNLMLDKLNELMIFNNFKKPTDNNFKLLIIMTIITLNEEILKLIETFDYPTKVPKLVIYNNLKEGFSDEDTIILAFLNLIGFDIVVFTPTNYNTIEQKLKDEMYDKFQLPSIQYDLQIPASINNEKGKSFFSRMFGI